MSGSVLRAFAAHGDRLALAGGLPLGSESLSLLGDPLAIAPC